MDIMRIIESKIFIAIISAIIGSFLTYYTQLFWNKRGIFSYYVFHNRIAQSAEDVIYGTVNVTWNGNPISNLYLSSVEVVNESLKDFESVIVRIYANNTILLTQKAYILGTTRLIDFTDDYKNKIAVKESSRPTKEQIQLFGNQRDFIVPIMNRGQIIRFEFLNSALNNQPPLISVDILHKGVKCKFKKPQNVIFGIPQNEATITGAIVGLLIVISIIFL
jgi:hypothetical protein